jgi:hypothetical protein
VRRAHVRVPPPPAATQLDTICIGTKTHRALIGCEVTMVTTVSKRSSQSAARSPHAHPYLTERQQLALALKQSADSSPVPVSAKPSTGGFLQVWMVIVTFLVVGTALPVTLHTQRHGFNALQASLAFFLILNILICFWEISLGLHIGCVKKPCMLRSLLFIQVQSFACALDLVQTFACLLSFLCNFFFSVHAATLTARSSHCKLLMGTIVCAAFTTYLSHRCP